MEAFRNRQWVLVKYFHSAVSKVKFKKGIEKITPSHTYHIYSGHPYVKERTESFDPVAIFFDQLVYE
jgi:hypothetical protein